MDSGCNERSLMWREQALQRLCWCWSVQGKEGGEGTRRGQMGMPLVEVRGLPPCVCVQHLTWGW